MLSNIRALRRDPTRTTLLRREYSRDIVDALTEIARVIAIRVIEKTRSKFGNAITSIEVAVDENCGQWGVAHLDRHGHPVVTPVASEEDAHQLADDI